MAIGSLGFAFVAGVLSSLSPCVLPILPLVFGAAVAQHRWAPVALSGGLALSFTAVGLFLATLGFSFGLDTGALRSGAAALLIGFGVVMLIPRLQAVFAGLLSRSTSWASDKSSTYAARGLGGQLVLGILLGAAWSPCMGPTLGAASVMAAQGHNLPQVGLTMSAFEIGATAPLLVLGLLSREAMVRWRGRLLNAGQQGKAVLGALAGAAGLLILTGADKSVEAALVAASTQWLTRLTSTF
jgi:cytochrome c-type biogenesis protein